MNYPTKHTVSECSAVVATGDQISSDLAGEAVILNLHSGVYYGLNAVGAWVWQRIQSPISVRALCDAMLAEYDVKPERCRHDLIVLLQQLADAGLVEVTDARGA